jgi:hypothetical protein
VQNVGSVPRVSTNVLHQKLVASGNFNTMDPKRSSGGAGLKGYYRYFGKKLFWFFITFIAAFLLNLFLPRMMP